MKKILCVLLILIFMTIPVSALSVTSVQHETGKIQIALDGSAPYEIYRSYDNDDFDFVASCDEDMFTEYGLEGGVTYFYKIIDATGNEALVRYSVPSLFAQINPLSIKNITDNQATIEWDIYDFKECDIYLDGDMEESVSDINMYTLDNLREDTEYEVYLQNEFGVKSNTITFRTTDYFDQLDKLLKELFVSGLNVDSDSDGLPDVMEPIGDKIDDIVDKVGGDTIDGVQTVIENVDYSTGVSDLEDLPKIETTFRGLNIKVFDLDDTRFLGMMEDIRFLVLCVLTVTFVFLVISFFDVKFKV